MYFSILKTADGQFWWRAVDDNTTVLAASELLPDRASCESGIEVLRGQAAWAPTYDHTDEVTSSEEA